MRKPRVRAEELAGVSDRLGDAAIDPAIWPEIMQLISDAAGAVGAGLIQSDIRTPDIPRTSGVDEGFRAYFKNGWHERDIRADRSFPLLLNGCKVVADQDIVSPEEMERTAFYREFLAPHGFRWFTAIGFWSGSAIWGLSLQRNLQQGPFDYHDKRLLGRLSQRLTEIATLSKAVGRTALSRVTNALLLVKKPALALDHRGFVLDTNAEAEQLFNDELHVKNCRLYVRDQVARSQIDGLIDRLKTTPDNEALPSGPIVVQRRASRPIVIQVLPIDGAARSPFLGARALLVLSDLGRKSMPRVDLLAQAFGLSPAEARIASLIVTGMSPEQAAEQLGIARETARNQLKAVFAKTDTHRQGQLIALLSQL